MISKAISGTSINDFTEALDLAMSDKFTPTLAIVFCSINQDIKAVCELLDQHDIEIFGASTAGEFADDFQGERSVVCMLLDMDPRHFTIKMEEIPEGDGGVAARKLAREAIEVFEKPAFVIAINGIVGSDPIMGETVVQGILDVAGEQVTIVGGAAGDDMEFAGSRIFTREKVSGRGLLAVVLDEERVEINSLAVSGWKAVGITKMVTKVEDGWVTEIDGKPALEVFLKYMGKETLEGEETGELFTQLGNAYPWQIERDSGRPSLCTPLMYNKANNSLLCEYTLHEGTKFRFSLPPDFDIIEEVIRQSRVVRDRFEDKPDALLVFSCVGRLLNLGPLAKEEVSGLQDLLDVPMAGFYSYGEFGKALDAEQEFHSTTIAWATLREK